MFDVATCPLCSAAFDDAEPYRDHLEEAHGLRDDEGTATVTQLRAPSTIEDEAAMSLVAEAVLEAPAAPADAEAGPPPEPAAPPTKSPAATAPPVAAPVPVAAAKGPTARYPLATRHGDVALYAPGLLLLLTALVRLEADVLGFSFLLLGAAMIVLGMLLPLVLGRR